MKKTLVIALAIVLCASLFVSCEEQFVPNGYYYNYDKKPYAYSFLGSTVMTHNEKTDKPVDKGTFVIKGKKMDILWDDGSRSSLEVEPISQCANIKINGTTYYKR